MADPIAQIPNRTRLSRRVKRAVLAGGLAAGLALPGAAMADNEPPDGMRTLTVSFDFNAGGLNVGEAKLTAAIKDGRYVASSKMKTAGLAEMFFKSRYTVLATGTVDEKAPGVDGRGQGLVHPSRYDSDFEGLNTTKLVTLIYDETGLPAPVAADPPYGKTQLKYPVSEDEQRASVDPMSAWIHMVTGASATKEAPCGETVPIFDGRRRYDLDFELIGEEPLTVKRGKTRYDGPAFRCRMIYRPIEGFKEDDDDSDALPIPPLQVWIVRMSGDGTPGGAPSGSDAFFIPIKLLAETPIGSVVMIADDIDFGPVKDQRRDGPSKG